MLEKISHPETLADRAYREIKQAIIQGKFLPGDLLPEETIASMMGISRTPIRNAIAKLAFDGLLEIENGKVARVAVVSEKELVHFLSLRQLLENFSAEQAVPFVTDQFINEMQRLMVEQKNAVDNKDWNNFIQLDFKFHVSIAEITQNQKLKEFIEQINNNLNRYLILPGTLEDSAHQAYLEHLDIIQSLQERNAEKARESMRQHIENVEKRSKLKIVGKIVEFQS
jgi:DNA-binding GntR family transcriptional regulator